MYRAPAPRGALGLAQVAAACAVAALLAASVAAAEAGPNGFSLAKAVVERDRILAGGPARDGIRSVQEPGFAAPLQATWVDGQTTVIGLALGGEARAYPEHVLERHQVVDDRVGGVAVTVTFDPLAGTPRVYRRKVGDRTLSFGVSGLVFESNFLLYDHQTESLWSQFDGRALAGPLAGTRLVRVPIRYEDMATWVARHPDTRVLELPRPLEIDYRYSPYEAYWVSEKIPFPVRARDDRFHPKELVLGVSVDGHHRAYLGSVLTKVGEPIEDSFRGHPIRVEYSSERARFLWEVPDAVRADVAYWFSWKAFHPDTEVWQPPRPQRPPADADRP